MRYVLLFLSLSRFFLAFSQNPIVIGECNFDSVSENCSFSYDSSTVNTWQVGTPQKPFFGTAWSAPNAIQTDTINPYATNLNSSFTLKFVNNVVDAEDWATTNLSFWHKHQTDSLKDFGRIYYSIDNGLSWLTMKDTFGVYNSTGAGYEQFGWKSPLMHNAYDYPNQNEVTGAADWTYSEFNWLWYLPVLLLRDHYTPDTMLVKFQFASDSITDNLDGWMIDDIVISREFLSGIDDPADISENLHLYPNPASSQLYFSLTGNESIQEMDVLNLQGAVLKALNDPSRSGSLTVEAFASGSYLLMVITDKGNMAIKQFNIK